MSTDRHWESWGAQDPYYGVLTHPRFRSAALNDEARAEFFHTGRVHAEHVLHTCRQQVDPAFAPQRVLDFGCGVGRVLIPFAGVAAEAVGVDVSPSMLAEAQRNCDAAGASNVRLLPSDDALSALDGEFDLVHSCIVLQHIEVPRGRALFGALLQRIRPGGLGALHVTFGWDHFDANWGQPPPPPPPPRGPRAWLAQRLRALPGFAPAPPEHVDPEMQMNFYNLSELQYLLQRSGVQRLYTEFTDHGGAIGAFMFFRRG
jgi:SAM-dependent methyltransferase